MNASNRINDFSTCQYYLFLISIIGITIFSQTLTYPNTDIAWLTLCADRLLKGGKFYTDIFELNLPFSVLLYIPSVVISKILPLSSYIITYLLSALLTLLCAWLSTLIIEHYPNNINNLSKYSDPTHSNNLTKPLFLSSHSFFISIVAASMITSLGALGERDHIIGLCVFPYSLLLLSPKGLKLKLHVNINIIIFILLGIGIILKPYYLLSLLSLHIFSYILYQSFRFSLPLFLTLTTVGSLLLISIFFIFPEWLSILPIIKLAYPGYNRTFLFTLQALFFYLLSPLAYIILQIKNKNQTLFFMRNHLIKNLLLISLSMLPVYLLQCKGWYYHALPVTIPLWVVAFSIINRKRSFILFILFLLSAHVAYLRYSDKDFYDTPYYQWIFSTLKKNATAGDTYLCLSSNLNCNFPLSLSGPYKLISRYPSLWPSYGIKEEWHAGHVTQATFLRYFHQDMINTLEDIRKEPPKIILIQWKRTSKGLIEDFSNEKDFIELLTRDYHRVGQKDYEDNWSTWIYIRHAAI
ncbi:MAG: hypothetical protein V4525_05170 [Pseudomonadota bacterium]